MLHDGDVIEKKYRVVRLIGEGGMGAVFEAEHETIRRRVAVKVLFADYAHDADMVLRFHREAQAAGRIGHDNICEVTDFGVLADGAPFLVMPLLKGEPLSGVVKREAPLAVDRAVDLCAQVLDGLAAAHRAGIVHRDLKPDNLFVTRLGNQAIEFVKILDFGIAKMLGPTEGDAKRQVSVTRTGAVLGTPCYMSPEQARGVKDVDHRADLYAAGTILYEMLTGKKAFDGDTYNEVLIKVVMDPLAPPRSVRPTIPAEVEAVILQAMNRDRDARYQHAEEFRRELLFAVELARGTGRHPVVVPGGSPMVSPTRFASGLPAATLPADPEGVPPTISPPPLAHTPVGMTASATVLKSPSRTRLTVAIGGALVVAAAVVATLVLSRSGGGPAPAGSAPAAPVADVAVAAAHTTPSSVVAAGGATAQKPAAEAVPAPGAAASRPPAEPPPPTAPVPAAPALPPDAGTASDATPPAPAEDVPAPASPVEVNFTGVPSGATIRVAGRPIEGTTATLPRGDGPVEVLVTLRGYEPFRTTVVPKEDAEIPVALRPRARTEDAGRTATAPQDAGAADTGPRTAQGRLGTTAVGEYETP